ncbi:hypothetical protein [Planctobacterium marinum]|uniref:Uncharacterized protein n=1 Tax=Planctobacterium marinum TaxID=1631968 RepID=A0AA48I8Q4_9ALTE|nr:hypothetical protein MACH26_35460 [Planctobacterium marinum]
MNQAIESQNRKFNTTKILEAIALLSTLFAILMFVIGHLSASIYFGAFDIDYSKYAETETAFRFAIQSTNAVLAFISSIVVSIVILIFVGKLISEAESKNKSSIRLFIYLQVSVFTILFSISFIWTDINPKEDLIQRQYIPYEVSFAQNKKPIYCVATLGTIGDYQVFIDDKLQTSLVATKSILSVKQMFKPIPIESIGRGASTRFNRNYIGERDRWLKKWNNSCSGNYTFELFDFNENLETGPPRP